MMRDNKARSLVKGVSWRIIGTLDTFFLAYFFLGDVYLAAPIAATEILTKIGLYFLHERIWNIVNWGRRGRRTAHWRSLAKGVSWRFFGSLDTMLISFIFSGNPWSAFKIGASEIVTKVFLFYLHERLWALIRWGRVYDETVKSAVV